MVKELSKFILHLVKLKTNSLKGKYYFQYFSKKLVTNIERTIITTNFKFTVPSLTSGKQGIMKMSNSSALQASQAEYHTGLATKVLCTSPRVVLQAKQTQILSTFPSDNLTFVGLKSRSWISDMIVERQSSLNSVNQQIVNPANVASCLKRPIPTSSLTFAKIQSYGNLTIRYKRLVSVNIPQTPIIVFGYTNGLYQSPTH